MKKLLLVAFAFVMGLSQCAKQRPVMPNYNGPAGDKVIQHVAISASYDHGDSKLNIETGDAADLLKLTWTDDVIKVFQVIGGVETEVSEDGGLKLSKIFEGGEQAEFEGEIIATPGEDLIFRSGVKPTSDKFYSQTGKLEDFKEKGFLCVEGKHEYVGDGNYDVPMGLTYAVLKLDLDAFGTVAGTTVTITADDEKVASVVKGQADDNWTELYVAIPAPNDFGTSEKDLVSKTYEFNNIITIGDYKWELVKSTYYTSKVTQGESIKIVPAEFTVGAGPTDSPDDDVKVHFSKSNLWYGKVGDSQTPTFNFEKKQWEYQPTSAGPWNPEHVSHFIWSRLESVAVADSYDATGATKTDVFFTNADDFNVNGEKCWRTLSGDEWKYLLGLSAQSRENAESLRLPKSIVGHGLVILPDKTDPAVMGKIESTSDLAKYGAVFLPPVWYRADDKIKSDQGNHGYWSCTPGNSEVTRAQNIWFSNTNNGVGSLSGMRRYGNAVRLVRDVE